MKNSGPNKEPRGIPLVRNCVSETHSFTLTYCWRSVKYYRTLKTPEIVVICKRILFLDNVEANKNVDLYNEYFKCTYGPKPGFLMLKLNTMVKSNNNESFLYYDNIHLNYEHGAPFLRNGLRSFICQNSINLPRPKIVQNFKNQK